MSLSRRRHLRVHRRHEPQNTVAQPQLTEEEEVVVVVEEEEEAEKEKEKEKEKEEKKEGAFPFAWSRTKPERQPH